MPRVTANGIAVYYEIHGSGEPLLLIAGTGGDHVAWNPQVAAFRKEYRCITFDPRGIGGTDKGSVVPYTPRLMADDAAALVEVLGTRRVHVAGASLGSAVAQELALAHPEMVHTLSLHSTWARTASHPHLRRQFELRRRLVETGDWPLVVANNSLSLFTPQFVNEHEDVVADRERLRLKNPPPLEGVAQHYWADLLHDAAERLPFISCPTLITVGAQDIITLPEYAQAVQHLIPGSDLVVFQGVGHLSTLQATAEFNRVQLEFLRRHPM
ncbi:MAG: alpha/beta fold hydrolase [Chloroflexi bacterium]|nr:alpha/beta fold hydrolase [Chloroflexota bacterium]